MEEGEFGLFGLKSENSGYVGLKASNHFFVVLGFIYLQIIQILIYATNAIY